MITRLEIDGFKTFSNFKIDLSPFVVIAGTNGSGKSNLFDAIQLLSRLSEIELKSAFQEQRGDARELFTLLPDGAHKDKMSFVVEMLVDNKVKDSWGNEKELKYTRLRYNLEIQRKKDEKKNLDRLIIIKEELRPIKKEGDNWYELNVGSKNNYYRPQNRVGRTVAYISTEIISDLVTLHLHTDGARGGKPSAAKEVEQTVLSGVTNAEFPHAFAAREEMRNWNLLQLNPVELRRPSPMLAKDNLGIDGSNLPSVLARMNAEDSYILKDISRELNNLLPGFTNIKIEEDKARDQYVLKVITQDKREFSSRVLSEGTLRLIALCTIKYDSKHKGVLCFEEPENGIHPFRLRSMLKLLNDLASHFNDNKQELYLKQIIVNTHSPNLVSTLFNKSLGIKCKIFYASFVNQVDPINKQIIRFTKLIPVENESTQTKLDLGFSEQDKSVTKNEVMQYLDTDDFEEAIKIIQSH